MSKGPGLALVGCAGAAGVLFASIFLVPLGVFYLLVSDKYENHSCNDPVDPFDLAYWLHIQAWNYFGTLCGLFVIYLASMLTVCNKIGVVVLIPTAILLVLYGLFQCAWTIIGMVEVARAVGCHEHAPELWNWSYAAVLINCVFSFTLIGGGSGGCINGGTSEID